MKRISVIIFVLSLGIAAASWFYVTSSTRHAGTVDAVKLWAAVKAYKEDLARQRLSVPASVPLKELIDRGLLTDADVSGFAGMEVTVSLTADERRPQDVLVWARLPDGQEIVALADGSVR